VEPSSRARRPALLSPYPESAATSGGRSPCSETHTVAYTWPHNSQPALAGLKLSGISPSLWTRPEIPFYARTRADECPLEQPSNLRAIEFHIGQFDHMFSQVNRGMKRRVLTIPDD
jgi:hypothetical protein